MKVHFVKQAAHSVFQAFKLPFLSAKSLIIKMFYLDKKNLFQVTQIMTPEIGAKDTSFL